MSFGKRSRCSSEGSLAMARHAWAAIAILICLCSALRAKERIWTSADGRTMLAEFVRELDGEVTFLRDGKIITLSLDRLSPRDQQIVRDLAAGKSVPDDPAPTPAPLIPAPVTPAAEASAPTKDPPAETTPAESPPVKPLISKPIPIESRTWTDVFGNQVTGKYVRIFGSNVVLLRGGKSVTVKFYELSSEDQQYVRELLTSRGQEGMIPPKVDPSSVNLESGSNGAAESSSGNDLSGIPDSPSVPGSGFPDPASLPPGMGPRNPPHDPSGFPGSAVGPGYSPHDPLSMPPPAGSSTAGSPFPDSNPPGYSGSAENIDYAARAREQFDEYREKQLESFRHPFERNEPSFKNFGTFSQCLSCRKVLRNGAETAGPTCPHCGVTWVHEVDIFNDRRVLNNTPAFPTPFASTNRPAPSEPAIDPKSARMIGLAIGVFIGLLVVAGIVIGTIYLIMSIASASSTSQQRHYR